MGTISLDKQIIDILPQLDKDEKLSILSQIKLLLKKKEPSVNRLTIDEYNIESKEAEARIDSGCYFTHEEVEELAKKW